MRRITNGSMSNDDGCLPDTTWSIEAGRHPTKRVKPPNRAAAEDEDESEEVEDGDVEDEDPDDQESDDADDDSADDADDQDGDEEDEDDAGDVESDDDSDDDQDEDSSGSDDDDDDDADEGDDTDDEDDPQEASEDDDDQDDAEGRRPKRPAKASGSFVSRFVGLRKKCEAMCHAVAPKDLKDQPLYLIWADNLANLEYLPSSDIVGIWHPSLDLLARKAIGKRWQGRGPCLAIDTRIAMDLTNEVAAAILRTGANTIEVDDRFYREHFNRRIRGAVLHELAHELEAEPCPRPAKAARRKVELRSLKSRLREHSARGGRDARPQPFAGHEHFFIRAALHLAKRAQALGYKIRISEVFNGDQYGLSQTEHYLEALGDEPDRMADWSFSRIRATRAPKAFRRLFERDVQAWERTQQD